MAIVIQPISPVAVNLFGLDIRWYALAYIVAFIVGYWLMRRLDGTTRIIESKKHWDDLLAYVILGTIIGGRLGYVLFYNLSFFIAHPLEIFMIWHGGMSFHGGMLGVLVSVFLFSWKTERLKQIEERRAKSKGNEKIYNSPTLCALRSATFNAVSILDLVAVVAPIGLFFGRIANFINMEVMGRATDGPLGIVFAGARDQTPRHASQLYEAALEGVVLFIIMLCLWRFTKLRERKGALMGAFAIGYAVFRIFCEQFREPDVHIGFLTDWGLTMGQLLSFAMLIAGTILFVVAVRRKKS